MTQSQTSNGNGPLAEIQRLRWLNWELSGCLGLIAEIQINGGSTVEPAVLSRIERFLESLVEADVINITTDELHDEVERQRYQKLLERRAERCHTYAFSVAPKLKRASQIVEDGSRKIEVMKERLLDPGCKRQEIWRLLVALEAFLGLAESALGESNLELILANDRPPVVDEPTVQLSLDFAKS